MLDSREDKVKSCRNCGDLGEHRNNVADFGILCDSCYADWKSGKSAGREVSREKEELKRRSDEIRDRLK